MRWWQNSGPLAIIAISDDVGVSGIGGLRRKEIETLHMHTVLFPALPCETFRYTMQHLA